MAKQNNFLNRMRNQFEVEARARAKLAMTLSVDAAILAVNECFSIGPERAPDFVATLMTWYNKLAELVCEDAKDDKALDYSRTKIDQAIQQIMGEQFQPWNVRHSIK